MDVTPKYGDSDTTLLRKIVAALAVQLSAPHLAPAYMDSRNRLLFKWAQLLSL